MSKLVIHAKIMIDGISDTAKKDQLITIEDDKITSIEDYHKTEDEVIEVNTITQASLTAMSTFFILSDSTQKKNLT